MEEFVLLISLCFSSALLCCGRYIYEMCYAKNGETARRLFRKCHCRSPGSLVQLGPRFGYSHLHLADRDDTFVVQMLMFFPSLITMKGIIKSAGSPNPRVHGKCGLVGQVIVRAGLSRLSSIYHLILVFACSPVHSPFHYGDCIRAKSRSRGHWRRVRQAEWPSPFLRQLQEEEDSLR